MANVIIDDLVISVDSLEDRSITLEQYRNLRANSDGFTALIPKLNDEALIAHLENNLKNCTRIPKATTYDDILIVSLAPELLSRFKVLVEAQKSAGVDVTEFMEFRD